MTAAPPHRTPHVQADHPFDVSWKERLCVLGLVVGVLGTLIALGLVFDPVATKQLFVLVPTSFFGAGKFLPVAALTGIPGVIRAADCAWSTYELGFVIGVMDTCTALGIVYSIELLYRVWGIKYFLTQANTNAQLVLKAFPGMRKFALLAIVLFVLFPLSGTGAIGGSLLGAILGLHRFRIIAAVCVGGFLGGTTMAWLVTNFGEAVQRLGNSPWLIGALSAVAVAFFWAMARAYKTALDRARQAGG